MSSSPRTVALVERFADADRAVEVGIGTRTVVAAGLADRGTTVTATDVVEREVPDGVRFVRDDVTDPTPAVYADADLVYALRCPPELQRALARIAAEHDARAAFTTLGGDPATVDATPERVPGTTLHWVETDGPTRW